MEQQAVFTSPELKSDLDARLRRIEGQVRGVQRMVEANRDCPDVLQQMAAIQSAVHQASLLLARSYLQGMLRASGQPVSDEVLNNVMSILCRLE